MNKLLLTLAIFISSYKAICQDLTDKNWDVRIDLSGIFFKSLGGTISNDEITSFQVSKWMVPGLGIYRSISPKISLGLSFTPGYTIDIEERWGLNNVELDGDLELNYKTPLILSFDFEYFPFSKGFFIGSGLQILKRSKYHGSLKGDELLIGENLYSGDVKLNWIISTRIAPSISLGYVIGRKRLLSFAVQLPIIKMPLYESIDFELTQNFQTVRDEEIAIDRVRNETFYYPVQFRIRLILEKKRIVSWLSHGKKSA